MEKCSGRWRQPKDRCFSSALHGGQQEQWDACALIESKRNTNSHTHILRRQSQHNHVSCFISQAMRFAPRTADLFCSSKINYTPYQVCRCSVDSGIMQLDYLALLNRVLCLNKNFLWGVSVYFWKLLKTLHAYFWLRHTENSDLWQSSVSAAMKIMQGCRHRALLFIT